MLATTLWQKARFDPSSLSEDELKILFDDRVGYVNNHIHEVIQSNAQETLFDLIMLVIDSLQEHRSTILKILPKVSSCLINYGQSQALQAIDNWHQQLALHWHKGKVAQNYIFLGLLTYTIFLWQNDPTPDTQHVMAKLDDALQKLMALKEEVNGLVFS